MTAALYFKKSCFGKDTYLVYNGIYTPFNSRVASHFIFFLHAGLVNGFTDNQLRQLGNLARAKV